MVAKAVLLSVFRVTRSKKSSLHEVRDLCLGITCWDSLIKMSIFERAIELALTTVSMNMARIVDLTVIFFLGEE